MRRYLKRKKLLIISEIEVHTGNGFGSDAGNLIKRFTTTRTNIGGDVTYADSASAGSTFTINRDGLYQIEYQDEGGVGNYLGVSRNSTQLTTAINSITATDILIISQQNGALRFLSTIWRLKRGDILRPHSNDTNNNGATSNTRFRIIRIGD